MLARSGRQGQNGGGYVPPPPPPPRLGGSAPPPTRRVETLDIVGDLSVCVDLSLAAPPSQSCDEASPTVASAYLGRKPEPVSPFLDRADDPPAAPPEPVLPLSSPVAISPRENQLEPRDVESSSHGKVPAALAVTSIGALFTTFAAMAACHSSVVLMGAPVLGSLAVMWPVTLAVGGVALVGGGAYLGYRLFKAHQQHKANGLDERPVMERSDSIIACPSR